MKNLILVLMALAPIFTGCQKEEVECWKCNRVANVTCGMSESEVRDAIKISIANQVSKVKETGIRYQQECAIIFAATQCTKGNVTIVYDYDSKR